jgi:LysR family transcriptional regulator, hca operon transcriptional activator
MVSGMLRQQAAGGVSTHPSLDKGKRVSLLLYGNLGSAGVADKDFVGFIACLRGMMRLIMELRHLRYFIAVAEEGSLTLAAEKRLHTAQPSLSRQIRDLEYEVGVPLLTRGVHGVELTAAGRAFLDHARLALTQAEAAGEAARRAAQPAKPTLAMGFQTGQEAVWLPVATQVLRDELPNIEVRVSSDHSITLADDLQRGKLDVAFLRREQRPDLDYKLAAREPLLVFLPSDHRLAGQTTIGPHDLAGETFIGVSRTPHVLRDVISDYFKRAGVEITPHYEIDNFAMAISLVASTRGVALLPASAENFLTWSVTSLPLTGEAPSIDLVVGYHKANTSPILKMFLSRIDDLAARTSGKTGRRTD